MVLVGRRAERARIEGALRDEPPRGARVVSLVGPAGVGKTTLALAVAAPHDAFVVRLEDAHDEADVVASIASALGVATTTDARAALDRTLARRDTKLLVLDGVEHVVSIVRALVSRWVELAPRVRFLVTSRQPLATPVEEIVHLAPLAIDDDALHLWERTVRRELPHYRLTDDDADELRALLSMLDGLPLAIELAAARRATLPLRTLADEVGRGLALLSDRRRPLDRHASLEVALDASHRLLDPHSRALLAFLSVFPADFDAPSVRALVLDASTREHWVDRLEALVDRSWVVRDANASRVPRFHLLQTVRTFAREREPEAARAAETTFVDRIASRAEAMEEAATRGDVDTIVAQAKNLRFAAERLVERGSTQACARVLLALAHLVPIGRGTPRDLAIAERALALPCDDASRAKILFVKALHARASRSVAAVRAAAEESARLAEATDQTILAGRAMHVLGAVAIESGGVDPVPILERARTLVPPEFSESALISTHLAIVEQRAGRHREAAEILRGALRVANASGDARAVAMVESVLGAVYGELGEIEEGRRLLHDAVERARSRDVRTFAYAATCHGALLHDAFELEAAASRMEEAIAAWTRASGEMYAAFAEETLGVILAELGRTKEARAALERAIDGLGTGGYAFALLGRAHLALIDWEEGDDARARARYDAVLREVTETTPFREAILSLRSAFDERESSAAPEVVARGHRMDVRVALRRVEQARASRRRLTHRRRTRRQRLRITREIPVDPQSRPARAIARRPRRGGGERWRRVPRRGDVDRARLARRAHPPRRCPHPPLRRHPPFARFGFGERAAEDGGGVSTRPRARAHRRAGLTG